MFHFNQEKWNQKNEEFLHIMKQPKAIATSTMIVLGCLLVLGNRPQASMTTPEALAKRIAFVAMINGEEVGAFSSKESIQDAFLEAKGKVFVESGNVSESALEIVQRELEGEFTDYESLQSNMYEAIKNSTEEVSYVYQVKIDDRSFAFDSKEAIEDFFGELAADYNKDKLFTPVVVERKSDDDVVCEFAFVDSAKVSSVRAKGIVEEEDRFASKDGGQYSLSFQREIQIVRCVEGVVRVVSQQQASELLSAPAEENIYYYIESGDSLSYVAELYDLTVGELLAMNPQYSVDKCLHPGDEFMVKGSVPFLRVCTRERTKVSESVAYETIREKDDSMYEDERVTVQAGCEGTSEIVYETVYVDGVRDSKSVLEKNVITEPVDEIVRVGTKSYGCFIKPISGGIVTSRFGVIDDGRTRPHNGLDWGCSIGTSVYACGGGTVIFSGYDSGDFGYMVEIRHENGIVTRYAHLDSCAVSVGDYVGQGELIAYSGNTGFSTGPHLHLEVIVGGVSVNPEYYLE